MSRENKKPTKQKNYLVGDFEKNRIEISDF